MSPSLQIAAIVYFLLVLIMSAVSFVTYWLDKRRAISGGRRIPERTLHLMALLGGWPGALLAQNLFRHKTQKTSFRILFWLVVLLHLSLVFALSYFLWQR